jgi:mRNA interferase MazF
LAKAYVPARGDIVEVNFNPQEGKEQNGIRPALVLSEKPFQASFGLALVCPITTKPKGINFEVPLTPMTKTTGVVLAHQVRTVDFLERKMKFIEKADPAVVNTACAYVRVIAK